MHAQEWLAEVVRRDRGEVAQLVLAPALLGDVERHTQQAGAERQHGVHPDAADVDRVAPHGVQRDLRRLCHARLGDAQQAVIEPHRHDPRHHLTQPRTNLVTEADAHHPLATGVGVADLEVDQPARGIDGRPDDADGIRQCIEHRCDQGRRRAQQRLETLVLDAHRPTLVRRRSRCSHRPATGRHGVLRPAPREQHRGSWQPYQRGSIPRNRCCLARVRPRSCLDQGARGPRDTSTMVAAGDRLSRRPRRCEAAAATRGRHRPGVPQLRERVAPRSAFPRTSSARSRHNGSSFDAKGRRCLRLGLFPQSDRLDGPRAQRPPGGEGQGEQCQQRGDAEDRGELVERHVGAEVARQGVAERQQRGGRDR